MHMHIYACIYINISKNILIRFQSSRIISITSGTVIVSTAETLIGIIMHFMLCTIHSKLQ
jgi:hypothetical protein